MADQSPMRQLIECPVCFLLYNNTNTKPKTISCGHTYCENCLQQLVKPHVSTITCPQDRAMCKIPAGGVNDLPTNFSLLNLVDITCEECHEKRKKSKCLPEHCKMMLCEECLDVHYRKIGAALKTSLKELGVEMNILQAECDNDEDVQLLEEQCSEAIEAVTLICDEFKQKLVQKMKERSVADNHLLLQWKTSLSQKITHTKSFIRESLSVLSTNTNSAPADVIGEIQKKLMSEKETISADREKPPTTTFHSENLKQELQEMFPDLLLVLMTQLSAPGGSGTSTDAAAHTQKDISSVPDYSSAQYQQKAESSVPDYSSAQYQCQYGTEGSGDRQLLHPWGICLSPITGHLAVTDFGNNRIKILDPKLQLLLSFGNKGSGDNQYQYPWGITVNSKRNFFISDIYNHRIQITSSDGQYLGQFGTRGSGVGQYDEPLGISCDEDDLLHICDSENYRVQVVKEDGEVVRAIGCKGDNPGVFKYRPWSIACSRVHDRVIVTDGDGNLHLFTHKGKFMKTIKAEQPPYDMKAISVAIDHVGNVIVGDVKGHRLVVLAPDGDLMCSIGGPGEGPGQYNYPCGITVTRDGCLYVSDRDNHRIQLLNVPVKTER